MSKLLRHYAPGQSVFITSVTANREPLLARNAEILMRGARNARMGSRFSIIAWVILPDHFHAIIDNPEGDTAKIVQRLKLSFSVPWRRATGFAGPVWQHRYWDHVIRSEEDMNRHIDYIHYNPVKHGLVESPGLWEYSSFRKFRRVGYYSEDWEAERPEDADGEFGE